jgi:hypothetical protein
VDVLPLYIVLMAVFPGILWLILRAPNVALVLSFVVYVAARMYGWNLQGYPLDKAWYFSPYAWQFLFVIGAWCGVGGARQLGWLIRSNVLLVLGGVYLAFAAFMTLATNIPLNVSFPNWLLIFPLDKTGLDPLRLLHFLILTAIVVRFVPADAQFLRSPWAKPLILCGEHSLEIFCLGVFLSFTAHILLIELSSRIPIQVLVSFGGIFSMVALASIMTWYKKLQSRAPKNLAV